VSTLTSPVVVEPTRGPGFRERWRRTGLGWSGTIAAAIAVLMVVLAIVGPWLAPHDPNAIDLLQANAGPSAGHPLGFDARGRDVLSRIIVGARTSLVGPLVVVALGSVLASGIAVWSAWRGGVADAVTTTSFNIVLAMPAILLAVLAVAVFGKGLGAATIGLALAYLPVMGRIVRSAALREVSLDYVDALRVMGVSSTAITMRHIVPNLAPLIVAQATTLFGYALLDLGAISFLGLGVQQPTADWGLMVNTGASGVLRGAPAESLTAGACIVAAACAFAVLGQKFSDRVEGRS
jgi:peptide/nickel transport system permease protein